MKIGAPVAKPESKPQNSYLTLYNRVLALPNGQALPVELESSKRAKQFWIDVCATGRAGHKRGIGGMKRGRIVYLYRLEGGKPEL